MHRDHRTVDVADQAVTEHDVWNFPVASATGIGHCLKIGNERRLAARLAAQRLVGEPGQLRWSILITTPHVAGGIRPRRFAISLSIMRLGSTAVSRCRIVSGAMW